ncbi:hypothetical protein ccbrp13_55960 [Ktedonobacteria bacterium brp13]|nr:hypothetical protein ccbrp13_55960 [Ktedonobacteria bacterium brp13]
MNTLFSRIHFWLQLKRLDFEIWLHRHEPDPEDEEMGVISQFFIDMPPLSDREITMNIHCMGKAPLPNYDNQAE